MNNSNYVKAIKVVLMGVVNVLALSITLLLYQYLLA